MNSIVVIFLYVLVLYTGASVLYHLILALTYLVVRETQNRTVQRQRKYAIIVPAHNEELLIAATCRNIINVDYPAELREIFIVVDNCTDKTGQICAEFPVEVMSRTDKLNKGKGYTLRWAFKQLDLEKFDALLILDADTTVEPAILHELDGMLNNGSEAIQCYIKIPNRAESWFTQLICVSRTINNLLYHHAKYKVGLSSYLMGSGMCFKASLLKTQPWTAFSLSEDWEYYAKLIENGKRVDFGVRAIVLQQESRSLRQATTQRLRWSKGRFRVVRDVGIRLFVQGLRKRNWVMADASLALLFPNWSLQINLILLILVMSWMLPPSDARSMALILGAAMIGAQGLMLAAGMYLAGDYWQVFKAVLVAPLFLVWKLVIDFLSVTGLYRSQKWIRTERHVPGDTK